MTRPGSMGTKSFTLEHEIIKPDGEVAIEGHATSVIMDTTQRAIIPVPACMAETFAGTLSANVRGGELYWLHPSSGGLFCAVLVLPSNYLNRRPHRASSHTDLLHALSGTHRLGDCLSARDVRGVVSGVGLRGAQPE